MLGPRIIVKRASKDEAEKPFWISFADLMTALMVLFLVVMSVALLAVTKTVSERERKQELNKRNIELLLDRFESAVIPVGDNRPVTHISLETAAQALLAFDNKTLRRQSSRVIFREALRRVKKKFPR